MQEQYAQRPTSCKRYQCLHKIEVTRAYQTRTTCVRKDKYVPESAMERNIDGHTTAFIVRRSLRYKRKYMNVSVATIPERLRKERDVMKRVKG